MATTTTPPVNSTDPTLYTFSQFFNSQGGLTYINSFIENSVAENQVNAKYMNIPFVAPDEISKDGSNFLYPVVYRQNGYSMDNNNLNSTQAVLTQPKADKWIFNLQRWYIFTYTINELGKRQGEGWQEVVAKQLTLGMQWHIQNKAKVIRERIQRVALATGNFLITPNFVMANTSNIQEYAYNLAFNIKYTHNKIVTQFTNVNYGIIENKIRLMLSYNGETTMINAAKGFGGSDAAFNVFKTGNFSGAIMNVPYETDLYLGNKTAVSTTNDIATGQSAVETLDLSNAWLLMGAIGAMIFPNNPPTSSEWKINFNFTNYAVMWNMDAAVLPWLAYTCYAYFMTNPSMTQINEARAWLNNLSMSNRFFAEYELTPLDSSTYNTLISQNTFAAPALQAGEQATTFMQRQINGIAPTQELVKADIKQTPIISNPKKG